MFCCPHGRINPPRAHNSISQRHNQPLGDDPLYTDSTVLSILSAPPSGDTTQPVRSRFSARTETRSWRTVMDAHREPDHYQGAPRNGTCKKRGTSIAAMARAREACGHASCAGGRKSAQATIGTHSHRVYRTPILPRRVREYISASHAKDQARATRQCGRSYQSQRVTAPAFYQSVRPDPAAAHRSGLPASPSTFSRSAFSSAPDMVPTSLPPFNILNVGIDDTL